MKNVLIQKINSELHKKCVNSGQNITSDESSRPYVIAIDGMSGSGKSTLALELHEAFPESNLFHMDDYFLRPSQRTEERLSEIGGNVDYERFKEEIICHLSDRDGLHFQRFDCRTQSLFEKVHVPWKPIVIIEGSYSQHPYFGDVHDFRVFLEISDAKQRERILQRNGKDMLHRFVNEWIPKENAYFEKFKIKEKAAI